MDLIFISGQFCSIFGFVNRKLSCLCPADSLTVQLCIWFMCSHTGIAIATLILSIFRMPSNQVVKTTELNPPWPIFLILYFSLSNEIHSIIRS
ncbi:hypothetical protein C2G38_2067117 [Gigaspora rosea]|uniref:Uncharacterized protein n=1 Tax=Gigaspora rosea TaxID=44941 RepID=A0A397VZV4_9GLOM|nr:hypothetical protein C2G38_2067117 [Gigaspora rosea]